MPVVGMEGDAHDRIGVRFEGLDGPACPAVPDLDGPVPTRGREPFAVGTERHAVHFRLVPQDQWLDPAEPLQVMPFPVAQVFRALAEELQGAAQLRVVGPDNKLVTRNIKLGSRAGNRWVVESGITPGEQVVVDGPPLRDGTAVTPTQLPAAAEAQPQSAGQVR